MTRDELIEKVARAICDSRCWPGAWDRANEQERENWRQDARAAIDIVLEEAARVAVEYITASAAVAAIRALKSGDGDE